MKRSCNIKFFFLGIPFYTSNADGTDKFDNEVEVLLDGFNISKCMMLNVSANSFIGKKDAPKM